MVHKRKAGEPTLEWSVKVNDAFDYVKYEYANGTIKPDYEFYVINALYTCNNFSIFLDFNHPQNKEEKDYNKVIIKEAVLKDDVETKYENLSDLSKINEFIAKNNLPDLHSFRLENVSQKTKHGYMEGDDSGLFVGTGVKDAGKVVKLIDKNTLLNLINVFQAKTAVATPALSSSTVSSAVSSAAPSPSSTQPLPAFSPAPDTFTTIETDNYGVVGQGAYGKIIRPQLKKYPNFNYKYVKDDSNVPTELTDTERLMYITKMFQSKDSATKEIDFIKNMSEKVINLSTDAQKYFFPYETYTYYEDLNPAKNGNIYINMPFGGRSLKNLLRLPTLQITPQILENLGKHHVFMMEEIFEKLRARRFYHNDMKPDNIVLNPISDTDYDVKIIDFGMAYERTGDEDDITDIPDDLDNIHGFYFNFPPTKIVFSFINLINDQPHILDDMRTSNSNENLYSYKLINYVRKDEGYCDHLDYFSTNAGFQKVADEIPKIKTKSFGVDKIISQRGIYKIIINYIKPILFASNPMGSGKTLLEGNALERALLQNYFEARDIYGLFMTYMEILSLLVNSPDKFVGFDNDMLKQKLILFLRDVLFTNHIIHGGIDPYKDLIKAHIVNMHTSPAAAAAAAAPMTGGAKIPELSALTKEVNYNISPSADAISKYQTALQNFKFNPNPAPIVATPSTEPPPQMMLCNVKHIKKILKIEEIKEDDLSDVPAEDAQKEENIPAPPAVPPEENKQKNPLSDMIGNIFTPPAPPKQTVPNYVAGGARKIRRRTRHRRPKKQNKTKSQIM